MGMFAQRQAGDRVMGASFDSFGRQSGLLNQAAAKLLESFVVDERVKHQPDIAALVVLSPIRSGTILAKGPPAQAGGGREQHLDGGAATAIHIQRQDATYPVGRSGNGQGDAAREMAVKLVRCDRRGVFVILLALAWWEH